MSTNVDRAIYNTVHEYRDGKHRGAVGVAEVLGRNPGTVQNKANPEQDGHYFSVRELIAIMNHAKDYRPLLAINYACHHAGIPLPDVSDVGDLALLDAYANVHESIGRTSAVIKKAFADGEIDKTEYEEIDSEVMDDFSAMLGMLSRLKSLVVAK